MIKVRILVREVKRIDKGREREVKVRNKVNDKKGRYFKVRECKVRLQR